LAKNRTIDAKTKIDNDQATLAKMQQDINNFAIENGANLATDIALYNQLQKMKANCEQLLKKIERDKKVLAQYQEELKAAEMRKNEYRKYKPLTGTEEEDIRYFIKEKEAFKQKYDPWHTRPPKQSQDQDFRSRRQEFQTPTPPSQRGQAQPPWQPQEQLQNRINQLQDEIRRLRSEMTEMRKLMKDLVEYEKKRPKPSLFEIDKDPMDIEENRHKKQLPEIPGESPKAGRPAKPLPEIQGDPLEPKNILPSPSQKKRHGHPLENTHKNTDEIEITTESAPSENKLSEQ
jgi:regulator of replication initiation timing